MYHPTACKLLLTILLALATSHGVSLADDANALPPKNTLTRLVGKKVLVELVTDSTLHGIFLEAGDHHILIRDDNGLSRRWINLDHVVTIQWAEAE